MYINMKTIWSYNEIKNMGDKFNMPLWDYQIRIIQARIPTILYLIHELNSKNQRGGKYNHIKKTIKKTNINIKCKKMNKVINDLDENNLLGCHNINNLNCDEGKDFFKYILNNQWDDACNLIIANNC